MTEMIKPRLVICDIDQTLVVKHKFLTDKAKHAIECLQAHGCYFGIGSGRPLCQITPLLEDWGVKADMIVANNGVELYSAEEDRVYEYFKMKPEWVKEALEIMEPFNFCPDMMVGETSYLGFWTDEMRMWRAKSKIPTVIVDDYSFYHRECAKIMFRGKEEDIPKVEAAIAAHPSPYFKGFKTGPIIIEFTDIHLSKAYAMKEFCKMKNIPLETVYGFGDTTNDNEMIEASGVGVCMLNGSDDTKALADYITEKTCDDDGWADFVENHILIPNGWM